MPKDISTNNDTERNKNTMGGAPAFWRSVTRVLMPNLCLLVNEPRDNIFQCYMKKKKLKNGRKQRTFMYDPTKQAIFLESAMRWEITIRTTQVWYIRTAQITLLPVPPCLGAQHMHNTWRVPSNLSNSAPTISRVVFFSRHRGVSRPIDH